MNCFNEKLIAVIETDVEVWSNRLRITELWVADDYQRKGIGHELIEVANEKAAYNNLRNSIM